MYKLIVILILPLFFHQTVVAQAPTFTWVKPILGENPLDPGLAISDMATDSAGNTYITGSFRSVINFGSGIALQGSENSFSIYLAKYDTGGTPLWAVKAQVLHSALSEINAMPPRIAIDSASNIYWAGSYRAPNITFGDNQITISRACSDCQEGYLVKVDKDGNILFGRALRATSEANLVITDVEADFSQRCYLAGTHTGNELFLEPGPFFSSQATGGCFLAAIDPENGVDWINFQRNLNSSTTSPAIALSPDHERIVMTGKFTGSELDFGNNVIIGSSGMNKNFAVWYDTEGVALTAGALESTNYADIFDFKIDDQYRLWTLCTFWPSITWNGQIFESVPMNPAYIPSMLTILAPELSPVKVFSINDTPVSSLPITSLTLTHSGKFYTSGVTDQYMQNIPGVASLVSDGGYDIVFTGGAADSLQWARRVGGNQSQSTSWAFPGNLMTSDAAENLYMTGHAFTGNFDGIFLNHTGWWIGKLSTTFTSTQGPEQTLGLMIRPNPATQNVQLTFPENTRGACRVTDIAGRIMREMEITQEDLSITVENWPNGMYFLEYATKQGDRMVKKFLIQH